MKTQTSSLKFKLHQKGQNMGTVLQLQKLRPTSNMADMNLVLMSTYSGICPTTAANDETRQFEME
ncbi:MAG TPA: hypothetical protein VI685_24850 [Candidatus Angelobacter sp.]